MQPNTIKYFLEIIFHFQKLFYGETNTHLQVNKWFEGQLDLLRIIFFFWFKIYIWYLKLVLGFILVSKIGITFYFNSCNLKCSIFSPLNRYHVLF